MLTQLVECIYVTRRVHSVPHNPHESPTWSTIVKAKVNSQGQQSMLTQLVECSPPNR